MAIKRSDIRVELSAPSQRQSAFSVRWASPILADLGVTRIADFGCGLLRNLGVLRSSFDDITLVETERRCESLRPEMSRYKNVRLLSTAEFEADKTKYDAIFLISVLHIIPDPKERRKLLGTIVGKLKARAFVVVDVPQSETYYNRKKDTLITYKDGFLMKWGTHYSFYKSFLRHELDSMFKGAGLLERYETTHISKHLIRIWRKKSET